MTKLFGKSKSKSSKPGGKRSMFASVGQSLGLLAAVRRRRRRRRRSPPPRRRPAARRPSAHLADPPLRAQDEPSVDVAALGPEDRACYEEWGLTLAQEVRGRALRAALRRRCGGGGRCGAPPSPKANARAHTPPSLPAQEELLAQLRAEIEAEVELSHEWGAPLCFDSSPMRYSALRQI